MHHHASFHMYFHLDSKSPYDLRLTCTKGKAPLSAYLLNGNLPAHLTGKAYQSRLRTSMDRS